MAQAIPAGEILLVEDDRSTAQSIVSILNRAGYRTTVCHCGIDALNCATEVRPLAVLVDVHLPDLNGLIVTQMLRQHLGQRVPIIVFSGDTSMETLNSLAHVGATYFLSKPTPASIIVQRVADSILEATGQSPSTGQ